jgi:hypothetical protein
MPAWSPAPSTWASPISIPRAGTRPATTSAWWAAALQGKRDKVATFQQERGADRVGGHGATGNQPSGTPHGPPGHLVHALPGQRRGHSRRTGRRVGERQAAGQDPRTSASAHTTPTPSWTACSKPASSKSLLSTYNFTVGYQQRRRLQAAERRGHRAGGHEGDGPGAARAKQRPADENRAAAGGAEVGAARHPLLPPPFPA